VINDRADPSYAPTAYLQAIQANPDIVGIGGTDGDSGKGAAIAVTEAGRVGDIKIVAMDRNDDMLPYIEDGTITGAVAQKSYLEIFLAFHMMHWQNTDALKVLPDWQAAGINPLPERVETGVMSITAENVAQFKHA
jgi:ribose transport system substrate-binding protein